jgi:hypothetical protein
MTFSRARDLGAPASIDASLELLATAVGARFRSDSVESRAGLDVAVAAFRASDAAATLLGLELARIGDDPRYKPERTAPGQVSLFESAECSIAVSMLAAGPKRADALVFSDARNSVTFGAHADVALTVARYRAATPLRADVFDFAARFELDTRTSTTDPVVVTARDDLLTAHEIETGSDVCVVQCAGGGAARFVWGFDRATLAARLMYPGDVNAARTALILDFLSASDAVAATTLAGRLLAHPAYFLRWKALQVLAARQPERVPQLLRDACSDEHPEIRTTARAVLDQLGTGA